MDKTRLRREIIERRNGLPAAERERLSLLAQNRLMLWRGWEEARSVALYAAAKGELDTRLLLDAAWASGKRVYLPRVARGHDGVMDFALCETPGALQPGAFGIMEPAPALCPACCFAGMPVDGPEAGQKARNVHPVPELFIVPGLAFDRSGRRLGWGGGYYDRFLPLLSSDDAGRRSPVPVRGASAAKPEAPDGAGRCVFIGLAYSFQIVTAVPSESWDMPVDAICTDEEFLWTR